MHAPAYKTPTGHDATPDQVTRWLRAFTFDDTDEGFLGLPLITRGSSAGSRRSVWLSASRTP